MRAKPGRKAPFRQAKEEVLVVCGGQTKHIYFNASKRVFRPSLGNISVITAVEAKNPMQIVEYVIKAQQRKDSYNAVWCVSYKDEFTDFDDAITYAQSHGIVAAYSNQAYNAYLKITSKQINCRARRNHNNERYNPKTKTFLHGKTLTVC